MIENVRASITSCCLRRRLHHCAYHYISVDFISKLSCLIVFMCENYKYIYGHTVRIVQMERHRPSAHSLLSPVNTQEEVFNVHLL